MKPAACLTFFATSTLLACANGSSDGTTGTTPTNDAGFHADAGRDVAADITTPDGSLDSDPSPDAPSDAADAPSDAADAPSDAADAPLPSDADNDTGSADAGPSGPNVIANPGFEFWTDGLPDAWKGATTNLSDDAVSDATSSPHGGQHACQLTNADGSHKRFSTAAFALADGYYDCTYWVRGQGEVRNAMHDGDDYSSYSSYTVVDTPDWQQLAWSFNLHGDSDAFELIFSIRSTGGSFAGLQVDDVYCARRAEPCDQVTCPEWATCDPSTLACEPDIGRCDTSDDCLDWETCDNSHTCVLAPGRCNDTSDCDIASATPVCDVAAHECVAGDPCEGVDCEEWQACDPATAHCVLAPGRCNSTADCTQDLPACDGSTRTCVSAEDPVNIVPNGGFESWSVYDIPYEGEHLIPDGWYGLDIPGSSEIDPVQVLPYGTAPHSGALALQLIQSGVAERFTSELFDVPFGHHTCVYWVRGKGSIRHRTYSSGGWSPYTDRQDIDTLTWMPVDMVINDNVHDMRVILYASYTDATKDHVQVDDVVCTKDP